MVAPVAPKTAAAAEKATAAMIAVDQSKARRRGFVGGELVKAARTLVEHGSVVCRVPIDPAMRRR